MSAFDPKRSLRQGTIGGAASKPIFEANSVMTQPFAPGDVFGVPLPDGSMGVGQVLSLEPDALNSVGCVFLAATVDAGVLSGAPDPIAALLTTPDLLKSGAWPVKASAPVVLPREEWPYEAYRALHWVGVKVTGSRNAQALLAAYHCLAPWDDWHDPTYLDSLLLAGVSRPHGVLLSRAD